MLILIKFLKFALTVGVMNTLEAFVIASMVSLQIRVLKMSRTIITRFMSEKSDHTIEVCYRKHGYPLQEFSDYRWLIILGFKHIGKISLFTNN